MKMKKAKRADAATALCRGDVDGVKCKYWRPLCSNGAPPFACHYLYDTGNLRGGVPEDCARKTPLPADHGKKRKKQWKNGGVANAGTKRNN